jgi:hypothetical protein
MSKQHAIILCNEGSLSIIDNQSCNGVFVDGVQTHWHSTSLSDGDVLTLGETNLRVVANAGVLGLSLPIPHHLKPTHFMKLPQRVLCRREKCTSGRAEAGRASEPGAHTNREKDGRVSATKEKDAAGLDLFREEDVKKKT